MFTGLIEEIGIIENIKPIAGGKKITIGAKTILKGLKEGDSISISGVCLTCTYFSSNSFTVDAVGETLIKSTIDSLTTGKIVNLETALSFSQKLGGHLVQGHVNGVGKISDIKKLGENYSLSVSMPKELSKYLIDEGSIAIDGISLTIAQAQNNNCSFSIIPHTWKNTNLHTKEVGDKVNVEIDVIAKYVENFLRDSKKNNIELNEEWLHKLGY